MPGGTLTCTACHRPTATGIHLCHTCADNLHSILNDIPELLEDLQDTIAKLDRMGTTRVSPGTDSTPPARLTALIVGGELRDLTISWAFMLTEYDGRKTPQGEQPLRYLRRSVNEIRRHDFAGDMLDELDHKTREAHRLIDRPRDIRILGTCWQWIEDDEGQEFECGGTIKADYEEEFAFCSQCSTSYRVQLLLAEAERRARGELMTAAQVRKFLADHARVTIKAKDFKNWVYLRHVPYVLDRVTTDGSGNRLYYPGDVVKVHHRMQDRRRDAA